MRAGSDHLRGACLGLSLGSFILSGAQLAHTALRIGLRNMAHQIV